MQTIHPIPPAVIAAAAALLQQYIPELTAKRLEALLTENRREGSIPEVTRKLTRAECAKILGVSVNSINRYVKSGYLRSVNISPRLVRIDPASVQELLQKGIPSDEILAGGCRKGYAI